MFRFAILNARKCVGDDSRAIYIYGLCEGRRPDAVTDGLDNDLHPAVVLPILIYAQEATDTSS